MLNVAILGTSRTKRLVPEGIIVFLNDTSVPTGWSRYSSADDMFIIGAGDTYAVDDNGGSSVVTNYGTPTTGTSGAHLASGSHASYDLLNITGSGGSRMGSSTLSAGGHTHDFENVRYNPDKRTAVMIKADNTLASFPAKTMVFGASSITGLDNETNWNNRYVESSTAIANTDESCLYDLSTAGEHHHFTTLDGNDVAGALQRFDGAVGGAHTPVDQSYPGTITENLKKVLLSLWTKAAASFGPKPGIIAMWEGAAAPTGWHLCDGNDGYINLQDCFILPVGSGSENTTPAGDNTLDFGASTTPNHAVVHDHIGTQINSVTSNSGNVGSGGGTDQHSIAANNNVSWLPPYYALTFIQKI